MTKTTLNTTGNASEAMERDTGLTARVIGTWTVAGAVFMGGFLVAALTLAERLNANALLVTTAGLFIVGALFGCVGGAVIGVFGRPAGVSLRDCSRKLGIAALYTLPALAVGFLAAGWISMTTMALYLGRPLPLAGVGIGWLVGFTMLAWAAVEGWTALHHAARRGSMATAAAAAPIVLLVLTLVLFA
jgi:hypothetical protein